jgi:sporulation-control protein spo0M
MIRFELPEDQKYIMSSTVTGIVIWKPENDKQVNWIVARLRWITSGRGEVDSHVVDFQDLPLPETILPGQEYRFPFSLTLPIEGPITYHGNLLNIDWQIEVELDIPWAINPTIHHTITVVPFPVRL